MKFSRLISFFAIVILAVTFVFASPPAKAGNINFDYPAAASAVKYPPGVNNSFREVRIVFVIENREEGASSFLLKAPTSLKLEKFSPVNFDRNIYKSDYRLKNNFRKQITTNTNFYIPPGSVFYRQKPEIVRKV